MKEGKKKNPNKISNIFWFCTNVLMPLFLLYHDSASHCSKSTTSPWEKTPTNTILSFGFPSLYVLPYVNFLASSQHSILLPKATSLQQSFFSVTITKQGIKVGKLAKVAATSLTFYRLCTLVWILSESSWDRLAWCHLQYWVPFFRNQ